MMNVERDLLTTVVCIIQPLLALLYLITHCFLFLLAIYFMVGWCPFTETFLFIPDM